MGQVWYPQVRCELSGGGGNLRILGRKSREKYMTLKPLSGGERVVVLTRVENKLTGSLGCLGRRLHPRRVQNGEKAMAT